VPYGTEDGSPYALRALRQLDHDGAGRSRLELETRAGELIQRQRRLVDDPSEPMAFQIAADAGNEKDSTRMHTSKTLFMDFLLSVNCMAEDGWKYVRIQTVTARDGGACGGRRSFTRAFLASQ
jgi:hypothetical protein